MKGSFKKSLLIVLTLLAMAFSALGTTPAYADDSTPPPATEEPASPPADESVTEETAAVEESVTEEPAPADEVGVEESSEAEAPAVTEEPAEVASPAVTEEPAGTEEAAPVEVLEQLPDDTQLIVLDESGEALSLATADAADVLAAPDPYFTVGSELYQFSAADCDPDTTGDQACSNPIQAAIDFLAGLNATPDDNTIYVEAGTYNENINIDGSRWTSLDNLYLQGAGSSSTTVNGYLNAVNLNNAFGLNGFTFNDWVRVSTANIITVEDVKSDSSSRTAVYLSTDYGDISVSNSSFENSSSAGLLAASNSGKITLDGVTASNNSDYGAFVYTTTGSSGDISIWNSTFDNNPSGGLYVESDYASVMLDGVTASHNDNVGVGIFYVKGDIQVFDSTFNNNTQRGLDTFSALGSVTLDGVTASKNAYEGAHVNAFADVLVSNSIFNDNLGSGLYANSMRGNVTLYEVTASGNGQAGVNVSSGSGNSIDVTCSTFSANDWGLVDVTSDLYLNGVNSSGNTSGDYDNKYLGGNVSVNDSPCGGGVTGGSGKNSVPVLYIVAPQTQAQLPGALDDGFTFGSALKVKVIGEAKDSQNLTFALSFPIPAGMQDAELVVMFWDGSAWVEVPGGSVVDGNFVVTVSQPGMYALVSK